MFQTILEYVGYMQVEKNTATKPARISPKMSSTNRFHSTAAKLPDRRSFPNFELTLTHKARNTIDPFIDPSSTLH